MIRSRLIELRQQLDEVIQSGSRDDCMNLAQGLSKSLEELRTGSSDFKAEKSDLAGAIGIINGLWSAGSPPPEVLPGDADEKAGLARLLSEISEVQKFALSLAAGDLSQSLEAKGLMVGGLKSLQANLRHLTWQARMIASGDLSQRVDFMGEFSESFNTMVAGLDEALSSLRLREEELSHMNSRLAAEISEVKKADEKLKEAYRDLESFSYSVSHDLRAPLRHMAGFAALLQKRLGDKKDERTEHYLSMIAASASRMSLLIDGLLAFSRLGRAALHHERVDLNSLLGDIIRETAAEARGRKVEWQLDRMPPVHADKAMLRLVFVNLISNALKFTSCRQRAEIKVGHEDAGDEYIFQVQDNGAGFDMQYAGKLFGVFQRLHSQSQFEGTGVGLANVRRIVQRHGGRTWAEAVVDEGATFYFSLPKIKE